MTEPETAAQNQRQVAVVPWLRVDEPIIVDGYRLEACEAVLERVESPLREQLQQIFLTFRDFDGEPSPSSVLWLADDGALPSFRPMDTGRAIEALRLLIAAGVGSAALFTVRTPLNAAHLEVVFQQFVEGNDGSALVVRRRDGETLIGGYQMKDLRFTRPLAAAGSPSIRIDAGLLAALSAARQSTEPTLRRLVEATGPFRRANLLDPGAAIEEDVFWSVTALEQLVVSSRNNKAKQIRAAVRSLVPSADSAAGLMLDCWVREAYDTRSEVHGKPARTSHWRKWVHALLAVEAFGLLMLRTLADSDLYVAGEDDEARALAFPLRVAGLRTRNLNRSEGGATEVWENTWQAATSALVHRKATERILRDAQQRVDG